MTTPLDKIKQESRARFLKEYIKTYKDILPEKVLKNGNPWFDKFLNAELDLAYETGKHAGFEEESIKCYEHCEKARHEGYLEGEKRRIDGMKLTEKIRQAERKRLIDFIDAHYLEHCRTQNGRDDCKNCGLNLEVIKSLLLE